MKKFILFGSGKVGRQALELIGKERVDCFIDNNEIICGDEIEGVKVYSFETIKKIEINNYYLVITVCENAYMSIAEQLFDNGIMKFFFYDEVENFLTLDCSNYNMYCERTLARIVKNYRNEIERYQEQITFTKDHIKAKDFSQAVGYERKEQLELVSFAYEFITKLEKIDLTPFLICGSLLGKLRHNGLIPWDDDVDFGLMREDYEKFIRYCNKNYVVKTYKGTSCNIYEQLSFIEEIMKECDDYFLVIYPEHIQINKGTTLMDRKVIDFFCFDRYGKYEFSEHKKVICELEQKLGETKSAEEKYRIISKLKEKEQNYIDQKGENIYFSLESFLVYARKNESWIPARDIFPLKRIQFERKEFWAPHNIEQYLLYEYKDYWSIPKDFGIATHGYKDDVIREKFITAEIYLTDAQTVFFFEPLYHELRKNGIYAKFVIEPEERSTLIGEKVDYATIKDELQKYNLEYAEHCNIDANIAITTQAFYTLRKYRKAIKVFAIDADKKTEENMQKTVMGKFDYMLSKGKFVPQTQSYKNISNKKWICIAETLKRIDIREK